MAKPYSVELDFGKLDTAAPLALAMTGWLHFGGGMANISASHRPELPFPFPVLEAETADGWQKLDFPVGAPVGKTKTILVDLEGKLPANTIRLRLSMAFEIHWNRIALLEKTTLPNATEQHAAATDLHWHGYGAFENHPRHLPLTPIHAETTDTPNWRITPSGWVTRYGGVNELIAAKDNKLAIIAAGDELRHATLLEEDGKPGEQQLARDLDDVEPSAAQLVVLEARLDPPPVAYGEHEDLLLRLLVLLA